MKNLKFTFFFAILFSFSNILNAQVTVSQKNEAVVMAQTSLTLSFTIPMGENRLLLVSTGSDLTPLSVTFDGDAMTQEVASGGGALWTLPRGTNLAAATTADIVFTITGATPAQYLAISAIAYNGVDQTTPVENLTEQAIGSGATSSSITIASKANDLVYDGVVVGCILCFSAPTATPSMGGTTLQNQLNFVGGGFAGAGATGTTPGAASVSPGWSFGGSTITTGVHNGLNVRAAAPLPVELSSFTVRQKKEDVILEWETRSEINHAGFEVQRSTDGNHFEKIAILNNRGSYTSAQQYQHIDISPPRGLLYFRLKQMDQDGSFEYSEVLSIDLGKQESFSIYPNPAKNEIHIETAMTETSELNIFDGTGALIKHFDLNQDQSVLDISDLPNGIYMTVFKYRNQLFSERLVKME